MQAKRIGRPPRPAAERFWPKVRMTHTCWIWMAGLRGHGYGQFKAVPASQGGFSIPAHRFAYELLVGPIPEGLQLDHLCRNRRCVNPAHLEPVTRHENILRGVGITAVNARKTHCVRGHELSDGNIYPGQSFRRCKQCAREYEARRSRGHR